MNRTLTFSAALILVWITGYLLIVGRGLLIPLIIAIFIWHLLNTLHVVIQRIPMVRLYLPNWVSKVLSLLVVISFVTIIINIITNNVNAVIIASSRYQENLKPFLHLFDGSAHFKAFTGYENILKNFSVQDALVNIYSVFTTLTSSAILITLYVVFLFVEQHYFERKIGALFPQTETRQVVDSIIVHIVRDTQTYLGLKTLSSLITAFASWCIMRCVGLDFAEFWALLIFFLSYIPNIGAIIATAFPAMLALVQFHTIAPFVIVTAGIVLVQFIIGNFIEPRFLGKSLNLSPFVILIALSLWGAIWGVLGMFLSVPITVMMMIVFAHFETTRPIAILLSQDGYVKSSYSAIEAHVPYS